MLHFYTRLGIKSGLNTYYTVFLQSLEAFSFNDSEVLLNQSAIVTSQLANITTGRELPLFPTDLQIINSLFHRVINILDNNILEDFADALQQPSVTRPDVVCTYVILSSNVYYSLSLVCNSEHNSSFCVAFHFRNRY